jgi:hypothetical protein
MGLIAARKGNLWMVALEGGAPVDQDEQRRAYACDFMKQLGIPSVAALGRTYVDLGIRVNAAARKSTVGRAAEGARWLRDKYEQKGDRRHGFCLLLV